MRKRILLLSLGITVLSWWIRMGPTVCAFQAQNIGFANISISSAAAATVGTTTPQSVGNLIFCTNCTSFNVPAGGLCVSTGTGRGAYVGISSLTAVTACN